MPYNNLAKANRQGYISFLASNTIYPRLVLAICALLLMVPAHATQLPNAPTPTPVFSAADWSLAGAVVAGRALDFTSTEQCLRRPYGQCHEIELPRVIAGNKAVFASFEVGMAGLSIFEQYQLTKHGHRRLAWAIQGANVALLGIVVQHNYRLAGGR
jgi:hypothetical protein